MKNKEKYKRYGVALMSFVFMITIAGYINYRYNPEREKNLGQTVYVSTNEDNVKIYEEEKSQEVKPISTIEKYKTDRDNMYTELANNYNQVINNENSSQEMVDVYQEKINSLLEEKNKILMTENIIKSRGIKDCVIVITDSNKASVLLDLEELDDSIAAQITDTIMQNFELSAQNITIENVNV
jgi:hypothetical protein